MTARRSKIALVLGIALLCLALAVPASAKQAPVTKMWFKVSPHNFMAGDTVSGTVTVLTREGHHWVGVPGATVSVRVDGTEVASVVADDTGMVAFSWVATEGDHVMRAVFAGDDTHKRAQRAQGVTVAAAAPEPPPPTT